MRITNLNSFSAIIDRIIIESLKIIQFATQNNIQKCNEQNEILSALKLELDIVCDEINNGTYKVLTENRTFVSDVLFENLFKLCLTNYCVSRYDALKLEECNKGVVDVENLKCYINAVRGNLEERAKAKNNLDISVQ
jgi:hypothetical protein